MGVVECVTGAVDGPDGGNIAVFMDDHLAVPETGRAAVAGDQFESITDADVVAAGRGDGRVLFG